MLKQPLWLYLFQTRAYPQQSPTHILTQKSRCALKSSPLVTGWSAKTEKEGIQQCPDVCTLWEYKVPWIASAQMKKRQVFLHLCLYWQGGGRASESMHKHKINKIRLYLGEVLLSVIHLCLNHFFIYMDLH